MGASKETQPSFGSQRIEVLLKKARVDPNFRALLLRDGEEAARTLGLELTENERALLASLTPGDIDVVLERIEVKPEERRVFLGWSVAAMLAIAGGCYLFMPSTLGISPRNLERIRELEEKRRRAAEEGETDPGLEEPEDPAHEEDE